MKNHILISISLLCLAFTNTYGQKSKVVRADKNYDNFAYIDAIKTYERVAEKGYKSESMFQKLGNAHYFNSELDQAARWYGELYALNPDLEPEYLYRYSQSLRSIGENEKANEMLEKFNQKSGNDSRGKNYKKNTNYLEVIKANSGRYKVEDAGINSKYSDYGSALYSNKLVFATARDTGSLGQRKHSWTNQYFTNLYSAEIGEEMCPSLPTKFDKNINSKFHESTPVFTKDGKTMYFTRNNYLDGNRGESGSKTTLLKIYKATNVNNQWANTTELPFNSNNYSTAHPILSTDEKTLYFVSDMPGTIGQSDIFKVKINGDNSYGNPENLGSTINTEGRETFPFISNENEIYFASDGHPGLGGLDVFVSKINADNLFSEIQNVGDGVNSPKDDFGYLIESTSRRGFFTSNREGGNGSDDIYKFLEIRRLRCEQELYGVVTDLVTKEILPNTKITLYDNEFNLISTTLSDSKGNYSFAVECSKTYNVRAEKLDYTTTEQKIVIAKENGRTKLDIALEKAGCKVVIGDDLGKCFGIKNIYFDLDKSNIHEKAKIDLEKILDVLNENPTMKLDIRSHTDSRASFKYNEALSDRRAKATVNWLIQNGINSSRLTGKGYGENQLVNKCTDDITCTEEEHQANRRSEFIITGL